MRFQNWTASILLLLVRCKILSAFEFPTNFSCRSDQIQSLEKQFFPNMTFVHIIFNKLAEAILVLSYFTFPFV